MNKSTQKHAKEHVEKRTEQLLAWYVNGTLVGPDRNHVEDALHRDPSALRHLNWESAVRTAIKTDPVYDVAADRGLAQVMQRIRADAPAMAPAPRATAAPRRPATIAIHADPTDLFTRFREWINLSPGLALACTLVIMQSFVISQMWSSHSEEIAYAESRAVQNATARGDTFIRIQFKANTVERQLSSMLRANSAEIVAGPTQLGEYYLLVKPKEAPQTLARMLTNPQVESAEIVNALPSKN